MSGMDGGGWTGPDEGLVARETMDMVLLHVDTGKEGKTTVDTISSSIGERSAFKSWILGLNSPHSANGSYQGGPQGHHHPGPVYGHGNV